MSKLIREVIREMPHGESSDPNLAGHRAGHRLSDGALVWPGDAAHYIGIYNVSLHTAFVEHITASGFATPSGVDVTTQKL